MRFDLILTVNMKPHVNCFSSFPLRFRLIVSNIVYTYIKICFVLRHLWNFVRLLKSFYLFLSEIRDSEICGCLSGNRLF